MKNYILHTVRNIELVPLGAHAVYLANEIRHIAYTDTPRWTRLCWISSRSRLYSFHEDCITKYQR
jgi:hypothetical protein